MMGQKTPASTRRHQPQLLAPRQVVLSNGYIGYAMNARVLEPYDNLKSDLESLGIDVKGPYTGQHASIA